MQDHPTLPPTTDARRLLWVLSPAGWALGWMNQPRPEIDQPGPQPEWPAECPAPEWGWALRHALGEQRAAGVRLHLLVCVWAGDARPTWWPDTPWRLAPWRKLAQDAGLAWQSVRVMPGEPSEASLWDAATQAWPHARALRGIHGMRGLLPRNPWAMLGLSSLFVTGLHLMLSGVLHPALMRQLAQEQLQVARAHEQELARQDQARAQAAEAERLTQLRVWQKRQQDALLPLQQWLAIVTQAEPHAGRQIWTEMRWSQEAWTVWGMATHEAAWQALQAGAWHGWTVEPVDSAATVWPAPPEEGAPVWRYQVRVQAPRPSRTQTAGGTP